MSSRAFTAPVLAGALLLSLSTAHAQAPLSVTVDGKPVDFGGAVPTQVGGRTLVPLRAIFEALGAQVEFSNGTIRARRGETNLSLALGSTAASVNGTSRTLEVPAQSVFGRTLVPLRFVGEAFGAGVNFNANSNLISITSPGAATGGGTGSGTPYTVPGAGVSVSGTLVKIDLSAPPTITISQNGALKIYPLTENPLALRQVSLATSTSATPVRQSARQITLANIAAGDSVRIALDSAGRASQVTSTATVIVARVQFAGGTQIVLDDERDTTLSIGPNLRFTDARGRVSNDASGLAPGQSIGLFISRDTKAIYQVSAYTPDFTASNVGTSTPDPITGPVTLPANGTPQIQLVQHSATAPLKAGSRLDVTVRATPGLRASFSLGAKVQNVALTENPAQPGVYSGSYTVKAGDDVLEGRVSARVLAASGAEFLAQGEVPITLDTIAPRLVGTFPANGAQISVAQPNIAVFADDLGGSGLGRANIDLLTGGTGANRVTTRIAATVAPPTSVNAVAPATLSGPVDVRATIQDKAGNVLRVNFGFTVATTGAGDISSFSHGANRALDAGDDVPLVLLAPPAGRATFDVISGTKTLARDVPLVETEAGKYRATYRVPASAVGNLRFIGKFNGGGQTSQLEATTKVQIAGLPTRLTVQTPTEGDKVSSPLVVRGQASPGATIDVSLRAEGTQFFILEYKQELGVQQVRADANGNWNVNLDLPALRNVSGLKFTISATQTDAAGKTSDPISVTVTR